MNRFFIQKSDIKGNTATIVGDDAAHISKVLRLGVGDEIAACDGDGMEYIAKIDSASKTAIELTLLEGYYLQSEPEIKITIFQGVPKSGKMETIVQKCTEIGAFSFVPFFCKRCVVRPSKGEKSERYQRVAYEAAKQSGRGIIPKVENPASLDEMLEMLKGFDLAILAWEEERHYSLKQSLKENSSAKSIAIIIGPEGGIEDFEAERIKSVGALCCTLGKRILRTETAGMAITAMILYEMDQMQ